MQRLLLIAVFIVSFVANSFASTDDAAQFVTETGAKTLAIVSDDGLSIEDKESKLNKLFEDSMDINWIAKFVMGRYWREASEDQQNEYTAVYKKFLMNSYVPKFRDYTDQRIEFKNVALEFENEYLVQTEVQRPGNPAFRIDYKIRKQSDGSFLIFDIIAEGISLITTQRADFGSLLSRKGVDYLIERLEAKVSAS